LRENENRGDLEEDQGSRETDYLEFRETEQTR